MGFIYFYAHLRRHLRRFLSKDTDLEVYLPYHSPNISRGYWMASVLSLNPELRRRYLGLGQCALPTHSAANNNLLYNVLFSYEPRVVWFSMILSVYLFHFLHFNALKVPLPANLRRHCRVQGNSAKHYTTRACTSIFLSSIIWNLTSLTEKFFL